VGMNASATKRQRSSPPAEALPASTADSGAAAGVAPAGAGANPKWQRTVFDYFRPKKVAPQDATPQASAASLHEQRGEQTDLSSDALSTQVIPWAARLELGTSVGLTCACSSRSNLRLRRRPPAAMTTPPLRAGRTRWRAPSGVEQSGR
jgi:hypothetical protein